MPAVKEIQVSLFGAFRDLMPSGICQISIRGDETVTQIKALLGQKLSESPIAKFDISALLSKSALATEMKVLSENDTLHGESSIAILPPVCGG